MACSRCEATRVSADFERCTLSLRRAIPPALLTLSLGRLVWNRPGRAPRLPFGSRPAGSQKSAGGKARGRPSSRQADPSGPSEARRVRHQARLDCGRSSGDLSLVRPHDFQRCASAEEKLEASNSLRVTPFYFSISLKVPADVPTTIVVASVSAAPAGDPAMQGMLRTMR